MGATAQVLRELPRPTDPNLLVGTDHFDDAGVYRLDDETALVMTVDFFPPLVDDPYTFGRIAAANALSDIYAMGGRPLSALNIVGFPDKELPIEVLAEILRGGAERIAAAKAVIAGGHSVRDAEIKYGMAVTGVVHPKRILTNGGAKVGDVLVLTKPLGSGILTSAAKSGKLAPEQLQQCIEVMIDLNAGACAAALEVGVNSCTDITGFGLIGHAYEMACASEVTLEVDAAAVPLMEHVLDLARQGVVTRAWKSNLECVGDSFDARGVDETLVKILADAQTSGGLLLAVSKDRAEALVAALKQHGTSVAAIIGQALPRGPHSIVLR